MQDILFAMALAVANPAAADHQGHGTNQPAQADHADHAKHDCKAHCEKMKQDGKKMECMEKHKDAKSSGDHANHADHSSSDDSQ